jgi:hypothetical protein
MRKLLIIAVILFAFTSLAQAEPWLVCSPQSDATGYIWRLNGGAWNTVPYATQQFGGQTWAVITDAATVPAGIFTYEVKAYKDDAVWGRLESSIVPLSGTRPTLGSPSGVGIKR